MSNETKPTSNLCKHCGRSRSLRNPTGKCNHLQWPDMLTDEARIANGYPPRSSTPTSKGILEKLSPEEREALREVCQAAMQYAMEWGSTEEECVKMKIRQLLGDVDATLKAREEKQ